MLRLDVYLEGIPDPVGALTRADDGGISYAYHTLDLPYPISQSLPLTEGVLSWQLTI